MVKLKKAAVTNMQLKKCVVSNLWHGSAHDVFVLFFVDFAAEVEWLESRLDFISHTLYIGKLSTQTHQTI